MKRNLVVGMAAMVTIAAMTATPVMAQKNYTDGGGLYGGAHSATQGQTIAKHKNNKTSTHRTGKFDPYAEGAHAKAGGSDAKKLPDERPQPDDVARTGKVDPYTEGQTK
jgi:hypothetical protein